MTRVHRDHFLTGRRRVQPFLERRRQRPISQALNVHARNPSPLGLTRFDRGGYGLHRLRHQQQLG